MQPPLNLAALVRVEQQHYLPTGARFAIAVVVSGLVCFALAALITRPVRRLRRAAQALASGDMAARVPERGQDEVAALARDFNVMADRIRDLLEAQRRLLRDVSHELRSPLARLRVGLELARKNGDTSMFLARVEREADRLEGLVTDVLSLARLEAGQTQLRREQVRLDQLLEAIVQDAAFEAEAAGKHVEAEGLPPLEMDGDAVLLRAAIENVVRNAVRYTAPASAVTLALRSENDEAIVEIRDHGPGVPEAELGNLFQPFSRVGEARDRSSGGFGLGLAISRQAVEAHGGRIAASNMAGGGLCVSLRLPRVHAGARE
jgi:two-component system sensor histidine kinase CpxA